MSRRHLVWLNGEMERWEREGVIDKPTAARIRGLYGADASPASRSIALTALSIVGALLVGLGIILLLARNWGDLSRPVRTILAFAPLLVTQALTWRVLQRGGSARPWWEAVATGWALSIGATVALIAQTYHLPGDFRVFLVSWLLLGLPIVYLLDSSVVFSLYAAGSTAWVIDAVTSNQPPDFYWWLLAAVTPWLWHRLRENSARQGTAWTALAGVVALLVGFPFALAPLLGRWWPVLFAALFACVYALDAVERDGPRFLRGAGRLLGALGLLILSIALTFAPFWKQHGHPPADLVTKGRLAFDHGILGLLVLSPLLLTVRNGRRWAPHQVLLSLSPLLMLLTSSMTDPDNAVGAARLFNLYPLGVGALALWAGMRREAVGTINLGMLFTGALVAARFFDSDMSFTARGLAFVILGSLFIAANIYMMRRKGGRHERT